LILSFGARFSLVMLIHHVKSMSHDYSDFLFQEKKGKLVLLPLRGSIAVPARTLVYQLVDTATVELLRQEPRELAMDDVRRLLLQLYSRVLLDWSLLFIQELSLTD
jgi:hypothetical protein